MSDEIPFFTQFFSPQRLTLLRKIGQFPWIDRFYLAFGAALCLRLGHREADFDLDLVTPSDQLGQALQWRIEKDLGAQYPLAVLKREDWTLLLDVGGVEVEFCAHGWPLLEEPDYFAGVKVAHLWDLALMKLGIALCRASPWDFYDLYYIGQKIPLETVVNTWSGIDHWPEYGAPYRRTPTQVWQRLQEGAASADFTIIPRLSDALAREIRQHFNRVS